MVYYVTMILNEQTSTGALLISLMTDYYLIL